jgi:hypothetical protein
VELGIGCDVSRGCITLNADGWQVDGPMKCKLSSDSIPFTISMTVESLTLANERKLSQTYRAMRSRHSLRLLAPPRSVKSSWLGAEYMSCLSLILWQLRQSTPWDA